MLLPPLLLFLRRLLLLLRLLRLLLLRLLLLLLLLLLVAAAVEVIIEDVAEVPLLHTCLQDEKTLALQAAEQAADIYKAGGWSARLKLQRKQCILSLERLKL